MSTRCNIIIKDEYNSIQLYRHCDGYPESEHGVIATLPQALKFAWPLPRMEASDMAAAVIAAWKQQGGGNIYVDGEAHLPDSLHGDIDYYYVISPQAAAGRWLVECFESRAKMPFWSGFIGDEYPGRRGGE